MDNAITLCRLLTHDIYKAQGLVWGNGWFAVEADAGDLQMILEIDNDEKQHGAIPRSQLQCVPVCQFLQTL